MLMTLQLTGTLQWYGACAAWVHGAVVNCRVESYSTSTSEDLCCIYLCLSL
jgi:hypothetical protein